MLNKYTCDYVRIGQASFANRTIIVKFTVYENGIVIYEQEHSVVASLLSDSPRSAAFEQRDMCNQIKQRYIERYEQKDYDREKQDIFTQLLKEFKCPNFDLREPSDFLFSLALHYVLNTLVKRFNKMEVKDAG